MEGLVDFFVNIFGGLDKNIAVFLISMIPLLELRGGIVAAKILGIPFLRAIWICVLGNILPIPFILLFITRIFDMLRKTKLFRPMVEKFEAKAMGKSDKIQKYEFWGLLLFVGIPLPGTGAWTGSLIAALLDVPLKKSIPAILCGIVLASVIMSTVSYFIPFLLGTLQ